jgi:hypothetical protein
LDESVADFWAVGDGLSRLDTPIEPPPISCVLLRRLGPSPFPEGRFPLLGLLATCYDMIGREAVEGVEHAPDAPASEDDESDE